MTKIKKLILTLVALFAISTGAWADETATITIKCGSIEKTYEDATLPWTSTADILKEVIPDMGFMPPSIGAISGGDGKVVKYGNENFQVTGTFSGEATVAVSYYNTSMTSASATITVTAPGAAAEGPEVTPTDSENEWTFQMPAGDVELEVEYYDELIEEVSNSEVLASLDGQTTDIYLDRTMTAAKWYTLCLPFNVDLTAEGPLQGITAKTLSSVENDGTTLTVTFSDAVASLAAGTPYIVQLPEDALDDIIDPLFENATISQTLNDVNVEGAVFKGTYDPVELAAGNKKALFLQDNKLYYPETAATINAFRAYIELAEDVPTPSALAKIIINFGGGATGIDAVGTGELADGVWYTLQGVQLESKPTEKGIYILNGKKVTVR